MKRIIAILAALLLALAGCGQAEKETEKKESSTPVQSREEATQGTAEEDQAYGQRYLEPVLAGRLLWCDFGPGEMEQLAGTPMIYAFEDLTGGERMRGYWEKYQGAFPREVMEDCLTAYFQVTPEELRDSLLAQYYRPEEEVYFYEGGRGGGPVEVEVTASRRRGDTLELDYSILTAGMDGGDMVPGLTGTVTILEEGEGAWKYLENRCREVAEEG